MTRYSEKLGNGTREVVFDFKNNSETGPWVFANVPASKATKEAEALKGKSHPLHPKMKCQRVKLEYFDHDPTREQYKYCNLHAFYETPEEEDVLDWTRGEPRQSISVRAGAEWVTLPQKLKWHSDDEDYIEQNIAIPMRVIYISIRKVQGSLPISIMRNLVGKINNGSVRMAGQSFSSGTLRFDSADSEEYGSKWNVTYNFAVNDEGWQKIAKIEEGDIIWHTTYPLLYETANLSRLV